MTPVQSSSIPGAVTQAPRAKTGSDNPAPNALLTVYGNLPPGPNGQALVVDSNSPSGFGWAPSALPVPPADGEVLISAGGVGAWGTDPLVSAQLNPVYAQKYLDSLEPDAVMTWADLADGANLPQAVLPIPAGQTWMVIIEWEAEVNMLHAPSYTCSMGIDVSGATILALMPNADVPGFNGGLNPDTVPSITWPNVGTATQTPAGAAAAGSVRNIFGKMLLPCNAGNTTFTAKYAHDAGTGNSFGQRRIRVIPLRRIA